MAMTDTLDGKRQSLYTPSPHGDHKRSKPEEPDLDQPNFSPAGEAIQIRDLMNDIRDLSDDVCQQQSQTRWLLHQTAETQRQESATKFSVKNWWKYTLNNNADFELMELHRRELVEHYCKEAGVPEYKLKLFRFSNFLWV